MASMIGRRPGRWYRFTMRVGHRLGWCCPTPVDVEPGVVWCRWCGLRGRLPGIYVDMKPPGGLAGWNPGAAKKVSG